MLAKYFIKMNLVICFVLLFCALSSCESPSPPAPTQTPFDRIAAAGVLSPTGSSIYPYTPTPFPPGYKNPYYPYNPTSGNNVPILSFTNDHGAAGTYSYSFTTGDGKQVQESGYLKDPYIDNSGEPQGTQVVQGSYAYVAPDGTPIQVSYVADENGFRPSGVHIPADGKGLPPPPVLADGKVDPAYNKYNAFYNNRYNRPYDPRYPFDSRYPHDPRFPNDPRYPHDPRYPYDPRHHHDPRYPLDSRYPYNPTKYNTFYNYNNALNKDNKEETKKDSS